MAKESTNSLELRTADVLFQNMQKALYEVRYANLPAHSRSVRYRPNSSYLHERHVQQFAEKTIVQKWAGRDLTDGSQQT